MRTHASPFSVFLTSTRAAVPNATQTTVTGLKWFKIWESGLTVSGGTETWAVDTMIANKGKVTFTIPSCVPSGQYLLRHEVIGESFDVMRQGTA